MTPIRIAISTPAGPPNKFFELLKVKDNANSKIPFEPYDFQKTILSQMGSATEEATIEDGQAEEVSSPRRIKGHRHSRIDRHG